MDPSKVLVMQDNRQLSRKRKRDSCSNSSETPPAKKALAPAKKTSPVKDSLKSRSDSKENVINTTADKDSPRRESRSRVNRGRSRDRHQRTSDFKTRPTENASDKGSFNTGLQKPGSSCKRDSSKDDTNRASATRYRPEECQAAEESFSSFKRASSREETNRVSDVRNISEKFQTVETPLSSFNRACSKEDINMVSALRNSPAECQTAQTVCSYENSVTTVTTEVDSSKETLKKADINSHSSSKETANPTDNKNSRNSLQETAIKPDTTDRNRSKEIDVFTKTEVAYRTRRESCSDKSVQSKSFEETARNSRGNSIETTRQSRGNSVETAVSSEEPTTSGRDSRNNKSKRDMTGNDKSSARHRDFSTESRRSYKDCDVSLESRRCYRDSKISKEGSGSRRENSRDKDVR